VNGGSSATPAAVAALLAATLIGALVLGVRGDLSLWLLPQVLLVLGTAYLVGSQAVERFSWKQQSVSGPLPIDFRLYEKVQEARATTRAKWSDRGIGALITLVVGVVVGGAGVLVKNLLER
jgi:hypothetical protein